AIARAVSQDLRNLRDPVRALKREVNIATPLPLNSSHPGKAAERGDQDAALLLRRLCRQQGVEEKRRVGRKITMRRIARRADAKRIEEPLSRRRVIEERIGQSRL